MGIGKKLKKVRLNIEDKPLKERKQTEIYGEINDLEILAVPGKRDVLEAFVLLQFNTWWNGSMAWMSYVDTVGLLIYEIFFVQQKRFYLIKFLDQSLFAMFFIDVLWQIFYIIRKLKDKYLIKNPPIKYLLCDISTLIPFSQTCYLFSSKKNTACYYMNLSKLMRFTRVVRYFGEQHANIAENTYFNCLAEYCAYIIIAAILYAAISYIFVQCHDESLNCR